MSFTSQVVSFELTYDPACTILSGGAQETTIGVHTGPGATQFTRIPFSAIFSARPTDRSMNNNVANDIINSIDLS
jgi:hypothetical protein